jgi:hypothetical protein
MRNGHYLRNHKTHVIGLQKFLWDKLPTWANYGDCAEDIWNNIKHITFEEIKRFVSHKLLNKSESRILQQGCEASKSKCQESINYVETR